MKVWQPCRTCLEARSASAQADYDLQAAIGATEIAHGDLATALGISPTSQFRVESIQHLNIPQDLTDSISPQSLYAISTPAPISS